MFSLLNKFLTTLFGSMSAQMYQRFCYGILLTFIQADVAVDSRWISFNGNLLEHASILHLVRLEKHLVLISQGSGDVPSHLPRKFLYLLTGSLFTGRFFRVASIRGWVASHAVYHIELDPGYPSFILSNFFDLDVSKELLNIECTIVALHIVRVVMDGGVVF